MKIVHYPDPILLQQAAPLEDPGSDEVREKVEEMFQLMEEAQGLGLAAPQVGWSARVFVTSAVTHSRERADAESPDEAEERPRVYINPRILKKSGREVAEEGCLSLPSIHGPVPRAVTVRMEATGLDGERFEIEAKGLEARVLQHEYDHLDGILFVSKVVPSQQKLVLKKLRELKEEASAAKA